MVLIFNDGTWVITTAAWSLGFPPDNPEETRISYQWGANGTPSAWMVTVPVGKEAFLEFLGTHQVNGMCDVRELQGGGPQ